MVSGCASPERKSRRKIWTHRQAENTLREALAADLADDRRRAIERISRSRFVSSDIATEALQLVLTSDRSAAVRSAAGLALGHSKHHSASNVLFEGLRDPSLQQLADADGVRQACLQALLNQQDREPPAQLSQDTVELVSGLLTGSHRQTRIFAARLLGYYTDVTAISVLISHVDDSDFAVAHEVGQALIRRTGQVGLRRKAEWEQWFEASGSTRNSQSTG